MVRMASFRGKPTGWRNDSHRHYLAAKGISTKNRYFSKAPVVVQEDNVSRTADFIENAVSDGRADTEDLNERMKSDEVNRVHKFYVAEAHKAEDDDRIHSVNTDRFFAKGGPFDDESKDYFDNKIDRKTFNDNVKRRFDNHMHLHDKKLKVWEW